MAVRLRDVILAQYGDVMRLVDFIYGEETSKYAILGGVGDSKQLLWCYCCSCWRMRATAIDLSL